MRQLHQSLIEREITKGTNWRRLGLEGQQRQPLSSTTTGASLERKEQLVAKMESEEGDKFTGEAQLITCNELPRPKPVLKDAAALLKDVPLPCMPGSGAAPSKFEVNGDFWNSIDQVYFTRIDPRHSRQLLGLGNFPLPASDPALAVPPLRRVRTGPTSTHAIAKTEGLVAHAVMSLTPAAQKSSGRKMQMPPPPPVSVSRRSTSKSSGTDKRKNYISNCGPKSGTFSFHLTAGKDTWLEDELNIPPFERPEEGSSTDAVQAPASLRTVHFWPEMVPVVVTPVRSQGAVTRSPRSVAHAAASAGNVSIEVTLQSAIEELKQVEEANAEVLSALQEAVEKDWRESEAELAATADERARQEESWKQWAIIMEARRVQAEELKKREDADNEATCFVCCMGDACHGDTIIFCDRCDVAVHQKCYDVPKVPTGNWFCRPCRAFLGDKVCDDEKTTSDRVGINKGVTIVTPNMRGPQDIPCILCPKKGGAYMKSDFHTDYAHLLLNGDTCDDSSEESCSMVAGGQYGFGRKAVDPTEETPSVREPDGTYGGGERGWVHVACARWLRLPETAASVSVCSNYLSEREEKRARGDVEVCYFCGLGTGGLAQCAETSGRDKKRCGVLFHTLCARASNVSLEDIRHREDLSTWKVYCPRHSTVHREAQAREKRMEEERATATARRLKEISVGDFINNADLVEAAEELERERKKAVKAGGCRRCYGCGANRAYVVPCTSSKRGTVANPEAGAGKTLFNKGTRSKNSKNTTSSANGCGAVYCAICVALHNEDPASLYREVINGSVIQKGSVGPWSCYGCVACQCDNCLPQDGVPAVSSVSSSKPKKMKLSNGDTPQKIKVPKTEKSEINSDASSAKGKANKKTNSKKIPAQFGPSLHTHAHVQGSTESKSTTSSVQKDTPQLKIKLKIPPRGLTQKPVLTEGVDVSNTEPVPPQLKDNVHLHGRMCQICQGGSTKGLWVCQGPGPVERCCPSQATVHWSCYNGPRSFPEDGTFRCDACMWGPSLPSTLLSIKLHGSTISSTNPHGLPVPNAKPKPLLAIPPPVSCCLCMVRGGALKRAENSTQWAHMVCIQLANLRFVDTNTWDRVDLEPLANSRRLMCMLCSGQGAAVVICSQNGCQVTAHAACAQQAGMSLEPNAAGGRRLKCLHHRKPADKLSTRLRDLCGLIPRGPIVDNTLDPRKTHFLYWERVLKQIMWTWKTGSYELVTTASQPLSEEAKRESLDIMSQFAHTLHHGFWLHQKGSKLSNLGKPLVNLAHRKVWGSFTTEEVLFLTNGLQYCYSKMLATGLAPPSPDETAPSTASKRKREDTGVVGPSVRTY